MKANNGDKESHLYEGGSGGGTAFDDAGMVRERHSLAALGSIVRVFLDWVRSLLLVELFLLV